jgi:tripartite-type tricarboxylate transporter receptor subunit TctC
VRKEVHFDWAIFYLIGTPEQTEWVFVTRRESPYKSIEDIRAAKEPPKCGSTGTGSFLYLVPKLMEENLGTKLTMITAIRADPTLTLRWRGAGALPCSFHHGLFGRATAPPGKK